MSMHLLMLEVAGTGIQHYTLHDDEQLTAIRLRYLKELQAGIFPNAIFQQAFSESESRHVDEKIITGSDQGAVYHAGHGLIAELLADPRKDPRVVSNLGDWLGWPGYVRVKGEDQIAVSDVYKYLVMEGLFNQALSVLITEVDYFEEKPKIVVSHLIARDAFYDQAYVDKNGVRSFLRYEPRTDKSRESTLGENHHAATPVTVYGYEYPTIDAAALAFNLPVSTVYNRINNGGDTWSNWRYRDREVKAVTYILKHQSSPGYYFGSTSNGKQRLHTHINKLAHGGHRTPRLQAMINVYGVDGLVYEVLLEGSMKECKELEQKLINEHWGDPNLLNASKNATSAISHHVQDPEVEKRRIEGLRKAVSTDEHRDKMSSALKSAWSVPGRKEARTGAGNPFAKHVSIHGVVYGSVIDAVRAKAGGLTDWVIRTRLKAGNDPALFYCDAEGNKLP